MSQPRFFCGLGMPKTGTTWLAEYLRAHSDIFIPLMKELQIFNRIFVPELYDWMNQHFAEILSRRVLNLPVANEKLPELVSLMAEMLALPYLPDRAAKMKAYRRLFKGRLTGQKLFGEFSTTYCLLPDAGLKRLKAAFPNPKFILMLRDPVNRYWSHLKHEIRRTLGKKNVHILFYESLFVEKDEQALRGLMAFLEIKYITPDFDKVVYAGEDIYLAQNLADDLRDRFEPQYAFLKENFSSLPKGIRL